jgi:hypothetical protein
MKCVIYLLMLCLACEQTQATPSVDVSSMTGKAVCGYQGWFRCEPDGAKNGWHHYGGKGNRGPVPGSVGIDLWPDVSEIPAADRFATGFRFADGSVAEVFSSVRQSVVNLHFQWMQNYGIDGVMLQRFATSTKDARFRDPMNTVLDHCKEAARTHGRGWALMYDLTGVKPGEMSAVYEDWKRLVKSAKVPNKKSATTDAAYFQHHGKPLVALWGLGFNDRPEMLDEWTGLIEFLRHNPEFGGYSILLGVPYYWRDQKNDCITNSKLHEVMAAADIISPWAVGRLGTPQDASNRIEKVLKPDMARCAETKQDYMPVIFPGFSWQNLEKGRGKQTKLNAIPRLGGQFLWSQAVAAQSAGAQMLYVAMFDEMDEGTAIFKAQQHPPTGESHFLSEPDVPGDQYLWLTGQITRRLRGEMSGVEMPMR